MSSTHRKSTGADNWVGGDIDIPLMQLVGTGWFSTCLCGNSPNLFSPDSLTSFEQRLIRSQKYGTPKADLMESVVAEVLFNDLELT